MSESTTTILVYKSDRLLLEQRYGKPTHKALHELLAGCKHPEAGRKYTTAMLPIGEAFTEDQKQGRQVTGFYCPACKTYVFPQAVTA